LFVYNTVVIGSTERIAPATDRLVAQLNASIGHHQFEFPQAHGEIKVQPHALGNDLFWKSVTAIRVGLHLTSITPARRDNAIFTSIDYPGATLTEATGINASGEIVGIWEDASSMSHGFIWSGGLFTPITFPGAASTISFGINDSGEVAGYYQDASQTSHGFLYQNAFTVVDVAGATGTLLTRVDNKGKLVL
jgi:probable HAF family extracellular repeat protein